MTFRSTFLYLVSFVMAWTHIAAADSPKVGFLIPLSGGFANLGEDNRHGVELAIESWKKPVPFQVVYSDSKAEPATAVTEFRKLTEVDKVSAVFVMRSPVGMAINSISRAMKIPIVGGVGDKKFAATNEYAFQAWSKSDEEGNFLASTLLSRGYKQIAVITTEDDWTSAVTDGFRDKLQAEGRSILFEKNVLPLETDFRTILLRLKTKSPDVLFANLGLAQIGPFLRQLHEQNLDIPVYSNFWIAKKDVIQSAGRQTVEGVRFVEMDTDLPQLRQLMASRHHSTPSGATLTSYIATLLMLQAGSSPDAFRSPQDFYSALLKQTEVHTPDGAYPIRDRCITFPLVEKVMRNGKAESIIIEPVSQSPFHSKEGI